MNIQAVKTNPNRQQNFGINFIVVPRNTNQVVANTAAKKVLNHIIKDISPKLRGELTLAMRDVSAVPVYMHGDDAFILSASPQPEVTKPMMTLSDPGLLVAKTNNSSLSEVAEGEGRNLLHFLRLLRPNPKALQTEEVLASEINVINRVI